MTGKQESLQDYFLMAKEIARQEKSLGIEHWDSSPYKKVMGVNIGMQRDIDTFVAAKAQYTKQQRILDNYISEQKATNMFFSEDTDQEVVRIKAKLAVKKANIEQAEARLIAKVEQYKSQQHGKTSD